MILREARLNDAPALAELARAEAEHQLEAGAGFRLSPGADWVAYARERLKRPDGMVMVAEREDDGKLVGFAGLRIARRGQPASASHVGLIRRILGWRRRTAAARSATVEPSASGVIDSIYVVPECRQRGIATGLLGRGLIWLESRRVSEFEAAIWAGNDVSLAFFRKAGFEPARVLVRRKPGPSADQMEKGA